MSESGGLMAIDDPGEHAKLWGGVGCWDEMDIEAGF
jgi:hypothetical protein